MMHRKFGIVLTLAFLVSSCHVANAESEVESVVLGPADNQGELKPILRGETPTIESATKAGPFQVGKLREADGLRDGPGYDGATIYYPIDAKPPFASVIIVPGYVSRESSIQEWGPFYASHGFVVMTIGTNQLKDYVAARAAALLDAKVTLLAEQTRDGSPLKGKLDRRRIGVSGWSMGGGGAQLAAVKDRSLAAVVALCPWTPQGDFDHSIPVLIFGGTEDRFAPFPRNGLPHFKNTPADTPKLMLVIDGKGHWVANGPRGTFKDRGCDDVGRFALSWLKLFLEGDERYRKFLLKKPAEASQFENNLITAKSTADRESAEAIAD
ncbi:MAG: triacylglycerol lipase [Planctomycetaceae bacterium]|nr:triacylglycerol lipase [Planctomycetaceae bacterium]